MSQSETITKINYWEKVEIPSHIRIVWEELASYKDIEVYAVGGAVRDLLMQQVPKSKQTRVMPTDWDLTTNATPSRIRTIFGARNVIQEENNKKFGVTFVTCQNQVVEVTTFREDITQGRKSEVKYSDNYVTDAKRRDFTINALYLDLNGRVHDPTGRGIDHITRRRLETPDLPDVVIKQDPLRLLRGARFIAKGFVPSSKLKPALFNNPTYIGEFQRKVPQDMVRKELLKIMADDIRKGVQALVDTGLMEVILPEFTATIGVEQKSPYFKQTLDKHLIETAVDIQRRYRNNDLQVDNVLVFIGLLYAITKPDHKVVDPDTGIAIYTDYGMTSAIKVQQIFKRLQFNNRETKRAIVLVKNHWGLCRPDVPHTLEKFVTLVDVLSHDNVAMRDLLWLYKGDLYAGRRQKSYLADDFNFPTVQPAIKSKEIMKLLQSTLGDGYDKKLIGDTERRMRGIYREFPNIATFEAREKVKDFIGGLVP